MLDSRIQELEGLTSQHTLSDIEFDVMRQLLTAFKDGIDAMTIQQKRAAIRTIVRKVVWDGVNVHIVLFGVQDDEIDFPDMSGLYGDSCTDDDTDEPDSFVDMDYGCDDTEEDCLINTEPRNAAKTHWGEDSK